METNKNNDKVIAGASVNYIDCQDYIEVLACGTPEEFDRQDEIRTEVNTKLFEELRYFDKLKKWTPKDSEKYQRLHAYYNELEKEYNQISINITNRYIAKIKNRASEENKTIEDIIVFDIHRALGNIEIHHTFFEDIQDSFRDNQKQYKDNPKIAKMPRSLHFKNFQNFYYYLMDSITPQMNALVDYKLPESIGTRTIEQIAEKYYKKPAWWDKKYKGTAPTQLSLDIDAERPVYTKPPTKTHRLQDAFTRNLPIDPWTLYDIGQEEYKPRAVLIAHNYTADFSAQFKSKDITVLTPDKTINPADMPAFNTALSILHENYTRDPDNHLMFISETQLIRAIHGNEKLMPTQEQKASLRQTMQKFREITVRIKLPDNYASSKKIVSDMEGAVLENSFYTIKDRITGQTDSGYLFKWFTGNSASRIFDYALATGQIDTRPILKADYTAYNKNDLAKLSASQHNSTDKTRVLKDLLRERVYYYTNKPNQNGNIITYQAIYERLGYDKNTPRQNKHRAREKMAKVIESEIAKLGTPAETSSLFYTTNKGVIFNAYDKNPENITLKKTP